MEIRLVSSLTADDELRMAPAVLDALGDVLNQLPIAYTLRIRTADGKGFAHYHLPETAAAAAADSLDLGAVEAGTLA